MRKKKLFLTKNYMSSLSHMKSELSFFLIVMQSKIHSKVFFCGDYNNCYDQK